MPSHAERTPPSRSHRSQLDRQLINAACHVLLGVVRLERHVALSLENFAETADRRKALRQPRQVALAEVVAS